MPAYSATAVVLRKTKLGESDTIVTLLTSDGVQVRGVAKGVRKTKSRFGARLEPYSVVELLLHTGKSLHVVSEARTLSSHEAIRSDFDRGVAAAVVADLLDKATVDAEEEPVLYQLALATLDAMEDATPAALPTVTCAFLLKAMSMIGFRPSLAQCARCGETRLSGAFSTEGGGALCGACERIEPGVTHMSPEAASALRQMMAGTMADLATRELSPAVADECTRLLVGFTRHHVPSRLKSLEFLSTARAQGTWPHVDPPSDVG